MKNLQAFDMMELTSRQFTPEGFLQAPATLARTGIQLYRAREFGDALKGVEPDRIIRLYRPPEEVFSPESMASFENKPVILEPHRKVTADNWRDAAVGDVHGISCNGEHLHAEKMVIRDKDAIDAIEGGKKFLSNGYTFDLDLTPGVTAKGEAYDGIQRNIRGNHVAIVSAPRGGSACRIADSAEANKEKKMKKIVVNGVPVEVGDNEAGIIETLIAERDTALSRKLTVKVGDKELTGDDITKELEAKDSEIADLRSKVPTEEQIAARVAQRVATVGDAAKLVEGFDANGKTDSQIQREVITAVSGKDATVKAIADAILAGKTVGDASDEMVAMTFKAVVAAAPKAPASSTQQTAGDAALASALTKKEGNDSAGKPSGSAAFFSNMSQGFQKKQ